MKISFVAPIVQEMNTIQMLVEVLDHKLVGLTAFQRIILIVEPRKKFSQFNISTLASLRKPLFFH
jgi:hypothetical protein